MSIDKLDESSLDNTFDREYILRIVLLVVVLVGLMIGGMLYLSGDSELEPTGDEEFNIEFSDSGVILEQTNGTVVEDNVQVRFNYYDGETSSHNVSISNLNSPEIVMTDREIYEVEFVEVHWVSDGEVTETLAVEQLSEEYTVNEPNVSVNDVELRTMETVELTASEFVDSDVEIESYDWSITGASGSDSENLVLQFNTSGTYAGQLTVVDKMGNEVTDSFQITVENPGLITATQIDEQVSAGDSLTLDATDFTSSEASNYEWVVNGVSYSQPTISHTFSEQGVQNIELTARDSFGYEETQTYQLVVSENVDVSVNVESQTEGDVVLSASSQSENVDSYNWDFGDGQSSTTQDSVATHTYESSGSYTVTVTATTENGRSAVDTTTVTVNTSDTSDDSDDSNASGDVVEIEMDSGLGNGWSVESVSGVSEDSVLQDDETGDQNPDLYLQQGQKYRFTGLNSDHPLAFKDLFGDPILSQVESTSYEDQEDIEWTDDGDSVSFVVTDDVAEVIDGYYSTEDSRSMSGTIFVEESE